VGEIHMNNSAYGDMVATMIGSMTAYKTGMEKWKDRIREQWEESKKLPRKKKKLVRKELLLDYSFACYDPFDMES
jgi:hypothetical protein